MWVCVCIVVLVQLCEKDRREKKEQGIQLKVSTDIKHI